MIGVQISDGGRSLEDKQRKGRSDCACRAMAHYLNVPYGEAEELLFSATNFTTHDGVDTFQLTNLLKSLGLTYVPAKIRVRSATAINKLPSRCMVLFSSHIVAYEEGVFLDTYDTTSIPSNRQTFGYFVETRS